MTSICLVGCHTSSDKILDSGATYRIICNAHMLKIVTQCHIDICLPNGQVTIVHFKGLVQLTPDIILVEVFLVSKFKLNLISFRKLTHNFHYKIEFLSRHYLIEDPTKKIMGIGKLHGNQYKLILPISKSLSSSTSLSPSFIASFVLATCTKTNISQF